MTKEEILLGKPCKKSSIINSTPYYHQNIVLNAMQQYADQETSELRSRLERMEKALDQVRYLLKFVDKDGNVLNGFATRETIKELEALSERSKG
ncbi:MAG: hypothetical protein K0S44_240 [Bacteroidetes bacterium]|jgi:hypothetical protein|nr:hypothetical protein [Bacteroidota bacterium]